MTAGNTVNCFNPHFPPKTAGTPLLICQTSFFSLEYLTPFLHKLLKILAPVTIQQVTRSIN
jgi:hypothetical protein